MQAPTLIAEIGCNHMGDLEIAKRFIEVAGSFCEVQNVKFQKRSNRDLLPPEQFDAPHPVPSNSFGDTYGAHREYLEFSLEEHRKLKDHCDERGMTYATSVWDVPSLREIATLEPAYLKVPSATNTNGQLLTELCTGFGGKIHVSLGMTTRAEEEQMMELFRSHGRAGDVVLYACTSGYPIQASEACLLEIPRLIDAYGDEVHAIGYSGHHNGISLDTVAFTLGATYIERHFTLDRTWKGTDHAASLEPDGLRRLQRNLVQAAEALEARSQEILPIEEPQRAKLKWRAEAPTA
ncbi:MAG TPA: N-acetylneuraminate synthase family protein [Acidimicrobiales bacterium]|nr:N-acetylneuraminate synthase family protein [Acidimicrobiales bacterium]